MLLARRGGGGVFVSKIVPGMTVIRKGEEWTVSKTELRGPVSSPELWALLVIGMGTGKDYRLVAREWRRFRDILEMEGDE